MNFGIAILIITIIVGSYALYLLNQQQMKKVENYNNIEVPEIKEEQIHWDTTQMIGWLYKNGTNKNFDNLILYFNQENASFFALAHKFSGFKDTNKKIPINIENMMDGAETTINNERYVVVYFTEED